MNYYIIIFIIYIIFIFIFLLQLYFSDLYVKFALSILMFIIFLCLIYILILIFLYKKTLLKRDFLSIPDTTSKRDFSISRLKKL